MGDGRVLYRVVYLGRMYRWVPGPGSTPWIHHPAQHTSLARCHRHGWTDVAREDTLGSRTSLGLGNSALRDYPAQGCDGSSRVDDGKTAGAKSRNRERLDSCRAYWPLINLVLE